MSSLIFVIDASGLLPLVEHLRELLDRREELVEVQEERDARCRLVMAPSCTSEPP